MRIGSICSGIASDAVAIRRAGLPWEHAWFSEIAPFPSKVLAQRYPEIPNVGDFTVPGACSGPVDLIMASTPCQSFSIAGLRGGLSDARGNLALEFARVAGHLRPRWIVWENVPGVLSADKGEAFRSLLGGLGAVGYRLAWRVFDAQFFGLAQRRKRVFLVGYFGGGIDPGAVLFEPESLRRDPLPGGAPGTEIAGTLTSGASKGSGWRIGPDEAAAGHVVAGTLLAREGRSGPDFAAAAAGHVIAFDPTQITHPENRARCDPGAPAPALARTARPPAIAFHMTQDPISGPVVPAISKGSGGQGVADPRPRRLTPTECERLMGLPDGYTAIPGAKDGPRYAALGNSIAAPCLEWIFRRIAKIDR